jgi:hypothetical protein
LLAVSHSDLADSPSPHPSPKIYQPKKEFFYLSAGNLIQNSGRKEPFMKQPAQKKPKVFRTLIQRIHLSSKEVQKDSKTQTTGKERKNHYRFFFGP